MVPLPRRPTDEQLAYYGRQLVLLTSERPMTAQRSASIKSLNEAGIGYLKLRAVEKYDEVMRLLHQQVAG